MLNLLTITDALVFSLSPSPFARWILIIINHATISLHFSHGSRLLGCRVIQLDWNSQPHNGVMYTSVIVAVDANRLQTLPMSKWLVFAFCPNRRYQRSCTLSIEMTQVSSLRLIAIEWREKSCNNSEKRIVLLLGAHINDRYWLVGTEGLTINTGVGLKSD